jgi:uncharacterized DUF497 family protein
MNRDAGIEGKHGVSHKDVEEAVYAAADVRRGREGLLKVFAQTDAGRYLLVVLAYLGHGAARIVTARDMTQSERRLYRRR